MLSETAPAKLNLFLHVLGKLENGYHSLESLVVFLNLSDVVSLTPDQPFKLSLSGSMAELLRAEGGDPNNNLVVKAAKQLAEMADKPLDFNLHLEKQVPIQAGLGGGSADAAACLRLLCRYWMLDWQDPKIMELALSLGADVPVCLHSKPSLMRGIGENIEQIDVPKLNLLVTNPLKAVSTQTIFQNLNLKVGTVCKQPSGPELLSGDFDGLLHNTFNDLQPIAENIEPAVTRSIDLLSKCDKVTLARMTGSGATCFALFETLEQARLAEKKLSSQNPEAWFWSGTTVAY